MNHHHFRIGLTFWLLALAIPLAASPVHTSRLARFQLVTVAEDLEHPWSLAFLPNGEQLVTERAGRLRLIRDGRLLPAPIPGVPELTVSGQGGLLDVVLHPDFERNRSCS